jgi:CubicO group peptidase (beta-lactamase class C family)
MDPLPRHLAESLERRLRERHVHGATVVAFDRDGIRFGGSAGFADVARGEPVTTGTVFRVASVSKQLTTSVVLRAVADGRLGLDDQVNDLLPPAQQITDAEGAPATATVRTLLSHTSGLPSSLRGAVTGNTVVDRLVNGTVPTNLEEAVTGLQLVRPPGERIVYANSGMNVAGYLAARAFGTTFGAAAREQVLRPLGMDRSEFTTRRTGPGTATPYGSLAPPGVSSVSAAGMQLVATPMGGLTTTAEDLARFGRMVLSGGALEGTAVIDAELLDEATTLTTRNHPALDQGYGLGFKVRSWRGRRLVGHDGNMPGVATQVWMAPDDGVGVVVLTNGFALGVAHETSLQVLDHLLGESVDGPGPAPLSEAAVAAAEAFARDVEGRYQIEGFTPPGVVGTLARLTNRVRVAHEARGLLRIEGNPGSGGPAWLHPTADPGIYRIAAAVDEGTNAVFDLRPDGAHLWVAHATLLRRT